MRKSLGSKRKEMTEDDIAEIVRTYGECENGEFSKLLENEAFGYRTILSNDRCGSTSRSRLSVSPGLTARSR